MCLYEPDKRVLVSGDHILVDNNIEYFPDCARRGESPGGLLANLDKAYHMDIGLVLPGRRSLIHDVRKRIDELKRHRRERAEEILTILWQGGANVYQVASHGSTTNCL